MLIMYGSKYRTSKKKPPQLIGRGQSKGVVNFDQSFSGEFKTELRKRGRTAVRNRITYKNIER